MNNLLTLEEVSARTRIPVATLRYWRSAGSGPPTFRLGRRVVAYADAVEAWIETEAAKDHGRHAVTN